MGDTAFTHRIRVRYAEVDQQRVVFNAHWLTYFDDSCTRFIEDLGWGADTWTRDFDVMLVKAVVEWQGPTRFDDWVDITVAPTRLGTTSFDLRFTATVDSNPAATATITYVSIVPGQHRPVEIPKDVRSALESRLT